MMRREWGKSKRRRGHHLHVKTSIFISRMDCSTFSSCRKEQSAIEKTVDELSQALSSLTDEYSDFCLAPIAPSRKFCRGLAAWLRLNSISRLVPVNLLSSSPTELPPRKMARLATSKESDASVDLLTYIKGELCLPRAHPEPVEEKCFKELAAYIQASATLP